MKLVWALMLIFWSFVFVCFALFINSFCNPPFAKPIVLPETDKVVSVDIGRSYFKDKKDVINIKDKAVTEKIIAGLSEAEPTNIRSVNDVPLTEDCAGIAFLFENWGENHGAAYYSVYVYAEDGNFYAEKPYEGIYKISKEFYEFIKSL